MKNLAWLSGGLVSARLKAGLGNLIIDIFSNLNDSININVHKNQTTTTTKHSGQCVSAHHFWGGGLQHTFGHMAHPSLSNPDPDMFPSSVRWQ